MPEPGARDRLGLALAGGGFRASLFHLGVLRRLAELDVLRHVQVLSTVSGGSIIGALYALRLKKWLEDPAKGPRLGRDDYVALVGEVDEILCAGIAKNLRTRLFVDPLTTLRVLLTQDSLGRAMARLYERHLFHEAVMRPAGAPAREVSWRQRRRERHAVRRALELGNLRIRPAGATVERGIDAYNAEEDAAHGSVLTQLIVNATSLNSGGRFFFSAVELGDWYLGQFRRDEVGELLARRSLLLEGSTAALERRVEAAAARALGEPAALEELRRLSLALWWRRRQEGEAGRGGAAGAGAGRVASEGQAGGTPRSGATHEPEGWERLLAHPAFRPRFPGDLATCALGLLRQAKLAAWYLRYGHERTPPVTGGRDRDALWTRVCSLLGDIDRELAIRIRAEGLSHRDEAGRLLLEFIVELYLLRTATRVSPRFDRDWRRLTLSDAVGASACFPPVFPPLVLLGLYDDAHVTRLALTDGGVYDNAGVTALIDEGCTSIIASDTGGLFEELTAAPAGHIRMVLRLPSILMKVIGGLQRLGLRERKRISRELAEIEAGLPAAPDGAAARAALAHSRAARELDDLAYFHIVSPPPALPEGHVGPADTGLDACRIAELRTDLDGFGEIEIAALVNHGYDTADRFARGFMQRYAHAAWKTATPELPKPRVGGERAERVLEAGRSRFLRALHVRAPATVALLVAAAALLVAATLAGLTPGAAWAWARSAWTSGLAGVAAAIERALGPAAPILLTAPRAIPDLVVPWALRALATPFTFALIAIGLLAAVARAGRRAGRGRAPEGRRGFVPLRTAWKWVSSYGWNALWLAWALPLLLAAAATVLAAAEWLVFFLPWRRAARIRPGDVAVPARAPEEVEMPALERR